MCRQRERERGRPGVLDLGEISMRATMERRIGAACGRGICCPTSEGGECFPVDSGPTRGAALPSTKGGGPVIYTIGSVIYADGYLTGTDDIPHADGWRRDLQLPKATTSREAVAARSATAGTSPPTSRQAGLRFFVPQSVQLESAAPAMGCSFSGLNALYDTVGGSGGDVWVKDYRFRLLRRLGDAGPVGSSVFLVKEVVAAADTTGVGPGAAGLARKKGVDPSHISADGTYALKKVLIQSNQHLELVRQEIQVSSQFSHPNLLPLVEHAIIAVKGMQNGSQNHEAYLLFPDHLDGTLQDVTKIMLEKKEYLPTINVLQIFRQLCAGLKHMHSFDPPYAHNGVKPDNVLITQRREQPLLAILMDFESARPARITIRSQAEALKLQEWASEHCSAYYRAPELWECPSHADIDERTDIWSLGCTLYAMMYRKSPFDYEIDESAGESLHAAVRSAHIKWPTEAGFSYPDSLRQFITWMLQPQPAVRPHIDDIIIHVDKLIAKYST